MAELLHLLQQLVGLVQRAAAEGQAPESDEVGGQVVGRHQRQRVLGTGNNGSCLKTGNYKENKKNNTRMLDTLFIEDFIDSMEEYFHFYNHNWQ